MPKAWKVCSTTRCPTLVPPGESRCDPCKRAAERRRGTSTQRGYGSQHRKRFRDQVLLRDPLCVCDDQAHGHAAPCLAPSRHADHHPLGRDELVAQGLDPDDPARGRGLCSSCHSRETARKQPGGWHAE